MRKKLQKIFKKIMQYIFKKIYGEINVVENNLNNSGVETLNYKPENTLIEYKVYFIKNGRLYTDRINDTAVIKENKLLDGPSFQLRDNINSNTKNNIVLEKGTPRKLIKINGNVLSLLTGGGGNDNYFHWLFDVLPRISICENLNLISTVDYFLCPGLNKFQKESLDLLDYENIQYLNSIKFRHIITDNLIVSDHPWNFGENILSNIENIPNWITLWLKNKFLKKGEKNYNGPKRIYIDRSDSISNLRDQRKIVNEKEVINFLIKKDFIPVKLSELKFSQQISLFENAEFIVGLHGAGLSNVVWCNKNTNILEINNIEGPRIYENLSKNLNLNYKVMNLKSQKSVVASNFGIFKIDLYEMETVLESF